MNKHILTAALIVGCSLPSLAQARSHHHHRRHPHYSSSYSYQPRLQVGDEDSGYGASGGYRAQRTRQSGAVYGLVTQVAQAHGVDPALAHAVVKVESGYNCAAKNRYSSATGLMQTLVPTAHGVGVHGNLRDCRTGLEAGMRYLQKMVAMTGGNPCAAATAYNRGAPGGCSGYGRKIVAMMHGGGRRTRVAQLYY